MKYKIVITRVDTVEQTLRGDYTTIDKRPWTDKELEEKSRGYDQASFLEKNPLKEVYGYAPNVTAIKTIETELLMQTLDDIDLSAVIKAINIL